MRRSRFDLKEARDVGKTLVCEKIAAGGSWDSDHSHPLFVR